MEADDGVESEPPTEEQAEIDEFLAAPDKLIEAMALKFIHEWASMIRAMADNMEELTKQEASLYHLAMQAGCIATACEMLVTPGGEAVVKAYQEAGGVVLAALRVKSDWADVQWVKEDGVEGWRVIAGGNLGRDLKSDPAQD